MQLERSDLELEVLVNRIDREELDLQPDYQRGEVWDRARRQRLIDTVLRNWYIPAIHVVIDEDLQKEFVLDGQQRLQTIRSFFGDGMRVSGDIDPVRDDLHELNNLKFSQLPKQIQMRVRRFKITVVTLSNYEPEEPSELFFRLNQQYALTPSEKRNALFGKARDAVREIVEDLSAAGYLSPRTIGFSNGRLAYDDVVSRFCVALTNGHYRVVIRNSDVEKFYRRDTFPVDVITRTQGAGAALGAALIQRGGVKLNKATLFTWLGFTDYLLMNGRTELPTWFVDEFEALRSSVGHSPSDSLDPKASKLAQIYNDRASYRVLDTASVLLRDLALHGIYALLSQDPVGRQRDLLTYTRSLSVKEIYEESLLNFAEEINWGANR